MTGVQEALREPTLPFFIGANARGARPGEARDAGGLTWIEVAGDERACASGSAAPSCRPRRRGRAGRARDRDRRARVPAR